MLDFNHSTATKMHANNWKPDLSKNVCPLLWVGGGSAGTSVGMSSLQ